MLFNIVAIVLVLILLFLLGVLAATIYTVRFHHFSSLPYFHTIEERAEDFPRHTLEERLQALGLHHVVDSFIQMSEEELDAQFYENSDRTVALMVVHIANTGVDWTIYNFMTEFQPFGSLDTDTRKSASIFKYPPWKVKIRAPHFRRIEKLLKLHHDLLEEAERHGFTPRAQTAQTPREMYDEMRQAALDEFEYQVEQGEMYRLEDGRYGATWPMAIRGTFHGWIWLFFRPLTWLYRPGAGAYRRRVAKLLKRARTERY